MALSDREREWANKARRYLKAELKRADVTYAELARRLREHGFAGESEGSVTAKLARGTFAVSFFLAVLTVLEIEGIQLTDM
jgi:hypothetical protein